MASITGFICDVCEKFSLDRSTWLKVSSYADTNSAHIDVCSSKCLAKLGRERNRSDAPVRERNRYSRDFKQEVITFFQDGNSLSETAKKFDLDPTMVGRWVGKYSR